MLPSLLASAMVHPNWTAEASTVARAAPWIPMAGHPRKPKMNTVLKHTFRIMEEEPMMVLFAVFPLFFIMQR